MKNDVQRYLKDIKDGIGFYHKDDMHFYNLLKEEILESEIITYDDLVLQFGTPNEIAVSYLKSLDEEVLFKKAKKSDDIRNSIIIILCSILICFLSFAYHETKKDTYLKQQNIQTFDDH